MGGSSSETSVVGHHCFDADPGPDPFKLDGSDQGPRSATLSETPFFYIFYLVM